MNSAADSRQAQWEHFAHGADIGVRGLGDNLAAALAGAGLALTAVICLPDSVRADTPIQIECDAPDDDMLLYDWLNALIYEMATRHMLFSRFKVRLADHSLRAEAWGESADPARHQPAVEIKGATYTELKVLQTPAGRWLAQCVVDV